MPSHMELIDSEIIGPHRYTEVSVRPSADPKKFEKLRFKKADLHPQTLMGRLELMYYRYRLLTGTDMLEPWERYIFSMILS